MWATSDGGITFVREQTGTAAHFNGVSAVSATDVWASAFGEGFSDIGPSEVPASALLHSTDGGVTWQAARMNGYGTFGQVSFVDHNDGWVVASPCMPGQPFQNCPEGFSMHTLLRTSDAGRSWSPVPITGNGIPSRTQWFTGNGYVQTVCAQTSGCRAGFFSTTDGGDTWAPVVLPPGVQPSGNWRFVSPERGYVVDTRCETEKCPRRALLETTDGGGHWRVLAGGAIDLLASFDATATHVVSPGGTTGIVRIDLTTLSVSDSTTNARDGFSAIAFASRDRAYALNRDGLWLSDDGGATWDLRPVPAPSYLLSAPSADVVWIVGTDVSCAAHCNVAYRSIDGGRTWAGGGQRFSMSHGLIAADHLRAWGYGEQGLWRTDDGGATWTLIHAAADGGVGNYTFVDHDFGWLTECGTECDHAFRVTTDGGDTWETRALPDRVAPVFFLDRHTGWAIRDTLDPRQERCFCARSILRTDDGGATWRDLYDSPDDLLGLSGFYFVDAHRGWALASRGIDAPERVYTTTDGGVSWTDDLAGAFGKVSAKGGRVWIANAGPGLYAFYGSPLRTTVWRRDYGATIAVPDTGIGRAPDYGRRVLQIIMLALTMLGGSAVAAGLRVGRRRETR